MTRHWRKTSTREGSNPHKPHEVNKPTITPPTGRKKERGGVVRKGNIGSERRKGKTHCAENIMNKALIICPHKHSLSTSRGASLRTRTCGQMVNHLPPTLRFLGKPALHPPSLCLHPLTGILNTVFPPPVSMPCLTWNHSDIIRHSILSP